MSDAHVTQAKKYFSHFFNLADKWAVHIHQCKQIHRVFRDKLLSRMPAVGAVFVMDVIESKQVEDGTEAEQQSFARLGLGLLSIVHVTDAAGKTGHYYDYYSDECRYGPYRIVRALEDAIARANCKAGAPVWVFCDGDRHHFKQSTFITLALELAEKLSRTFHLIYFLAGHGKFLCDEHGGCAKDRIDVLVTERSSSRQHRYRITCAAEAVAAMSRDTSPLKNTSSHVLPPAPGGTLYRGKCLQGLAHMSHVVCVPGTKRVYLTAHPDDCDVCVSPTASAKCTNKECGASYLHSNQVRSEHAGKWTYLTAAFSSSAYGDSDGSESEESSDASDSD